VGKKLLIKISMGKLLNEMGNCPFASPLIAPLPETPPYSLHIGSAHLTLISEKLLSSLINKRDI